MKIIVNDPGIGKFEWELPPVLEEVYTTLGSIFRNKMHLSEEDAKAAEEVHLQEIQGHLRAFLHMLIATQMVGGPKAIILQDMFVYEMGELSARLLMTMRQLTPQA